MTWHIHLESMARFGLLGHRLYAFRQEFDGSTTLFYQPMLQRLEASATWEDGKFLLSDEVHKIDVKGFLQAASDAAWELGIKPKQVESHANELVAVRYHLEDMRQLAGVKK